MNTLVVRPYYRLHRLTTLTLVVEVSTDELAERLAQQPEGAAP